MKIRKIIIFLLLNFVFLCSVNAQQEAELQDDKLLKTGISNYRAENYDEALEIFKKLRDADPNSSLTAYYLGLTYKRLEDYVEAKKHLEASLYMTPKIKGALIELIDTLYRLDEIDAAKKWIKVAEDEGIRPAQAVFLKGLTLAKSGEYEEAIKAFNDAKALNEELAQSANFQIGVAYLNLKKFKEAKSLFKDLIVLDPHTDIAAYAEQYIDALDEKMDREKPLRLTFKAGFEYDSNVVLKPGDTSLVMGITDKSDTREVYDFKFDYTHKPKNNDSFSLKSGYNFHLSKENDLGRYDYLINSFSLQPNFSKDKFLMTFPANFSHIIVDEKNYLYTLAAGNIDNILFENSTMAQAGVIYKYNDYLRPPYGEESRTGNELMGLIGWFWFFMKNEGFLGARYAINQDWTKGVNWRYLGHRPSVSLLVPFLDKFKFNANAEIFIQRYEKTNTIFDVKRRDEVYTISTFLSYEFIKNAELQLTYTYVNDHSNISLYSYNRNIVGCSVQYKF